MQHSASRNLVAIIQARMTSSRLPGKVMMEVAGQPVLAYMLERLRSCAVLTRVVVATSARETDDPVARLCGGLGVDCFRGDEHDVLGRYAAAAEWANADPIVRLTADCPMIDPALLSLVVKRFAQGDCDYASNTLVRTFPDGLDVEVFSLAALQEANRVARHPFLREHVTPYIRGGRPEIGEGKFRRGSVVFHADFGHVRWTLDTSADLERIRELVGLLPPHYTWLEALSVATKRPHLLGLSG